MTPTLIGRAARGLVWGSLALSASQAMALSLGLQINPDRVRPGEAMMVQITVTNNTGTSMPNVALQARMPAAGVSSISQSLGSAGATCPGTVCDANEVVTWNLGLLAPGAGVTVSMPMPVATGTAEGSVLTVPVTALVGGVAQLNVSQSVTVDVDNALSLSVDADKMAAAPGERLTYTLSYGNRSTASSSGTTMSLPLPAGVSLVGVSGGGIVSNGAVQWSLGTLQAGQSGRQQVVVAVDGALASGTLLPVAAAQISGSSALTGAEVARAHAVTRVQTTPVLGLAYAMNTDPVRPGEAQRITLTVSNRSDASVFGAVLRARMPTEGMSSISQNLFTADGSCPGTVCDGYELASWPIGTLAPGASRSVSLPVPVTSGMASGRLMVHEAELTADGVPMALARHTAAVDGDHALALAVAADKDTVAPGETLTYSLTYGNRASHAVSGSTLVLPLPTGLNFVSASGGGTWANGAVSWPLGTLQAGQSGRQQVQVTVADSLPSGYLLSLNAAQIGGTSAVTGVELARGGLVTRVERNPVLGLAYAVNADPVRPGEGQTVQLTVTNRSDATVFGTALRLRMPTEGVSSLSQNYFSLGGTCAGTVCDGYELAHWDIGTLAPGAAVTVSAPMPITAGMTSGRLVTHEAEATADGVPPVNARHTTAVDADQHLTLAVDADADSVAPGQTVTYRLSYGNRSSIASNSTLLTVGLPEGAELVGASGGTVQGRTVSWPLGTLLAGTGGVRSLTLRVPATAPPQRRLVLQTATLSGSNAVTGAEQARASRVTRIQPANPLKLALSLSRWPVAPGQLATATLRLTNTGQVPLISVKAQARMPLEGVSSVSQSALSAGASCAGTVCDAYELATWQAGTLLPGASVSYTVPLNVVSSFTPGRLIGLEALATSDAGDRSMATGTLLVGTAGDIADSDGDGVADAVDNCIDAANADQRDADGDGYGNACDADFDNNGITNVADLARFKAAFGTANPVFDLDGNGIVNVADLALFKARFGRAPGPSGLRP